MSQPIILYDMPTSLAGVKRAYSGNCWRTRFMLNYKQIPYKTIWIEFADVQTRIRELGAAPTATAADGTSFYSLPTIFDPNTKQYVSDSVEITKYLDSTYPGTTPLFIPPAIEQELIQWISSVPMYFGTAFGVIAARLHRVTPERSQAAYQARLLPLIGGDQPLAERDYTSDFAVQELYAAFGRVATGLEKLVQQLESEGKLPQDGFTLADTCVIAVIMMLHAISSDQEFQHVLEQDGRKLGKLYDRARPYLTVDDGEWDKVDA